MSERNFRSGSSGTTLIDAAIFSEWVVNEAVNALAHVMCELVAEARSSRPLEQRPECPERVAEPWAQAPLLSGAVRR